MAVSRELRDHVIMRDALFCWQNSEERIHHNVTFRKYTAKRVICVVPFIDPSNPDRCSGKQEVDHVKDEPMMGKRAPDDEFHLVAMCQNHNTWHPPRKELRQAERDYLGRYAKGLRQAPAPPRAPL